MKALRVYVRGVDKVNKLLFWIVGAMLAGLALVMFVQVFYRYVLNESLVWSEELSRYLMLWSVFLGAAIAVRRKSMIAVEAIMQVVPARVKRVLQFTILICTLVFAVILFVQGFKMAQVTHAQLSTALRIHMSIPYGAIPVGGFFIVLNVIAVGIEMLEERQEA